MNTRILLVSMSIVSLVRALPAAEPEAPQPTVLPRAVVPIVIDGNLDDAAWQAAPRVPVNYIFGKKAVTAAEVPMIVMFTWDDQYLYLGYEVFDTNVYPKGSGIDEGPPTNRRPGLEIYDEAQVEKVDVVEFFISLGSARFFWELHHNANNQFNDVWVQVVDGKWPIAETSRNKYGQIFSPHDYLEDDGPYTVKTGAALTIGANGSRSTVNDDSDVDVGYSGEIRVPWQSLGTPMKRRLYEEMPPKTEGGRPWNRPVSWRMDGQLVHIMTVCQNGDLKDRYHHSAPQFGGGWFHQNQPVWPVYRLGDVEHDQ